MPDVSGAQVIMPGIPIPEKDWSATFGGPGHEVGHSVQETRDGGHIIAGFTDSYGSGWYDAWLIKTNSAGNELLDNTFGGSATDYSHSVQEAAFGSYIVADTLIHMGLEAAMSG